MKSALLLWLAMPACMAHAADSCAAALAPVQLALQHSDFALAESSLNGTAINSDKCPAVLLIRARIAAAKDNTDAATQLFLSYIQQEPGDAEGYAYFARMMIEQGDYARADATSATAVEKSPENPAALAVRGQLLAIKGDRQRAVNLLTRATQLAPEDEDAQFQLGAIYDRARTPAEAVKHFKKATELNRDDARAWDYLALQLDPMGQVDAAQAAFQTGMKVNHDGPHYDAFLDYNYGRFLMKKGDLTGGKLHLERAVTLVPDMRATWYEKARVEMMLKDFVSARKDAEKAASLPDPDGLVIDLQVYSLLAQVYRRLGESELADKYAGLARATQPPVRGERH